MCTDERVQWAGDVGEADAGGMRRAELPRTLGDAFATADAIELGVSKGRLAAADLRAPYRGVRVTASHGALVIPGGHAYEALKRAVIHRADAFANLLGDDMFFSHVTSAVAWDIPVPGWALAADRPLDVSVHSPARHPRRQGVRGHQMQPELVTTVDHPHYGWRVATPVSTWATLAAVVTDPWDLVIAGDRVVRERIFERSDPPLARIEHLHAAVHAGRRVGRPMLRESLSLIRTRSASPGETRCRLTLLEAGLPEPVLNHPVFDSVGQRVAHVDLAYPDAMIAIEYEGEYHLTDPEQWARDIARYELLAALGWTVIRVTKRRLCEDRAAFLAAVRSALA